jgi:membrane associated rhomboid family serine protease
MKYKNNSATQYLVFVISALYFLDGWVLQNLNPTIKERLELFKYASYNPGDLTLHGVNAGEWYRLITVVFTHANILHLLTNMLSLWIVGSQLEQLAGKSKMLITFFGSAIIASLASMAFLADNQVSVGASGAIFGVFGGLIVYAYRKHLHVNYQSVIGTLVINALLAIGIPGIDWHAHLGGFIGGCAIAFLLSLVGKRPKPNPWQTSWDSDLSN